MALPSFSNLIPVGRVLIAVALIGYGAQFLIYARAIGQLSQTWPSWLGGAPFTEYLAGATLIATGLAILTRVRAQLASFLLGGLLLLWILGLTLPPAIAAPKDPRPLNNVAEAVAVCAALFFVAQSLARQKNRQPSERSALDSASEKSGFVGRVLLVIGLVVFGSEHLIYADFVATLVPAWIPAHLFWAEFCGVALLAAAVGILFNLKGTLAAALLGLMILLFGALVNAPLVVKTWHNADAWTSLFHTLTWSGAAFVLAGLKKGSDLDSAAPELQSR